jgi:alpha-L-fucosidase
MSTWSLPKGAKIKMVGTDTSLKWNKTDNGFSVSMPERIRNAPPSKYVWVMKATF